MKVGIITLHKVYNYGAVLQAYALKTYLQSILPESDAVTLINYVPPFLSSKKKLQFSKNMVSNLIEMERLLLKKQLARRAKAFDEFIERNDSLSPLCLTKTEVEKLVGEYDVLISGSDQIWNFCITNSDKTYLLDFPDYKGKKFSYSSSLGNFRFYKSNEDEIRKIFESFSALSCRESDGCDYLNKLTDMPCEQVCDPTLLLNSDVYSALFEGRVRKHIIKLAEEKFLLIYNLSSGADVFETAKAVAKARGLKTYQIIPSLRKNSCVDKLLQDISIEEFLYLYSNADFIVTNSFHGTCFSLIYNKDFYTVTPTGSSNRLETLLSQANLSDRLLIDGKTIANSEPSRLIDYAAVNESLDRYVAVSKDYLKRSLAL